MLATIIATHDRKKLIAGIVLTVTTLLTSATASAYPPIHVPDKYKSCFFEAEAYYGVRAELLAAIAHVESRFNSQAVNHANHNGTYDVGIMQINSWWFDKLYREYGISESDLYDYCTSIYVGAWVLANNFVIGGHTWESVGAYNAGFSPQAQNARNRYIQLVKSALDRLAPIDNVHIARGR